MRRDEVTAILKERREDFERFGVISVHLFGSVARDDAFEGSDVDILAEFERPLTFKSIWAFVCSLKTSSTSRWILSPSVDFATVSAHKSRKTLFVSRDYLLYLEDIEFEASREHN